MKRASKQQQRQPKKKKQRQAAEDDDVPSGDHLQAALAAHGERFLSMFDDDDDAGQQQQQQQQQQRSRRKQQPAAAGRNGSSAAARQPSSSSEGGGGSSSSDASSSGDSKEESEKQAGASPAAAAARAGRAQPPAATATDANSSLEAFLSRKGPKGAWGQAGLKAAARPSKAQLVVQQQEQEQQRLLQRRLKKQFMSAKVSKIFDSVDVSQLQPRPGAEQQQELSLADFAAMRRDVELLGASALDKRSAKAHKSAMLARIGAAAEKRPRIPAKQGLGMARKAKQREAVALAEGIAAGMVKAKGRGKKLRAEKAKERDRGLMEAGPGFKNGVLRLPKGSGGPSARQQQRR